MGARREVSPADRVRLRQHGKAFHQCNKATMVPQSTPSLRDSCAILIPVGPSDAEVSGLVDLISSLRCFAREVTDVILIDDGVKSRSLADLVVWPGVRVVSLRSSLNKKWVDPFAAQATGTMMGLAYAAEQLEVGYVLKLDTDTVAIGPFHDAILTTFRDDPLAGIVGACDVTPGQVPRDFSLWAGRVARAARALHLRRTVGLFPARPYYVNAKRRRKIDALLRLAMEDGYQPGRHCLGGAYAVGARVLERLRGQGVLADPLLWNGTGLGEDVALAIAVSAVGFSLCNLVADGEPFGITLPGLPDAPQALLERGFGLIHSVKGDAVYSELRIRTFCRELREQGGGRRGEQ